MNNVSSLTGVSDFGGKDEGRFGFGFGDPWTVTVTHTYFDTFSPDGVMIQMVQNFFTWFASPIFWLTYIPFYERFFPVFVENITEPQTSNKTFLYKLNLKERFEDAENRDMDGSETTLEISFGRFGNLMRSFANVFEAIQR